MAAETPNRKEDAVFNSLPATQEPVRFLLLIRICAVAAGVIGLVALLGWSLGIPFLASLGPDKIPMAPSTAVLLALFGVTIFLRTRYPHRGSYWAGFSIHAAVALISLLLAVLSYQGIQLEADHLGFSIKHIPGVTPVGHMSPVTAICFLLASLSFLASLTAAPARPRRANTAWLLACLLLTISYLLVLAYLFGTPLLYGSSRIPPALPTSLAFAALGTALLALAWPHAWPSLQKPEPSIRSPYSLIVIYFILSVGIMAAGYLFYRHYETNYRTEVEQQLTAVADLTVAELVKWRSERMGDAEIIYKNAIFSNLVLRYIRNHKDREAELQLRDWIGEYPTQYEYDQVRLLDPQGVTRMSAPAGRPPASAAVTKRIAEVLQSGRITIVDFYLHDHDQRIYLSVLIPILNAAAGNRVIGVVALRIDPEKYLYPFILRWPTPSQTAETLLVRRDGDYVLYLANLRFRKDAALKFRLPLKKTDVPPVMAVLGRTGIVEGVDYRGEPVIADVRSVPDSPWFLVTRMNTSEVNAPARWNLLMIAGFVFALLFGSGTGLAFVWRQQSMGFYQDQYRAEESLRENKARLDLALQSAFMGVWQLDIIKNRRYFDEQTCHLLGIDPATFTGAAEEFLRAVHPDDRETLKTALSRTIEQDVLYEPEYRMVWPNGSVHYITARGRLVRDDKGRPVKINGIIWDITERKKAVEALKKRAEQYRTLVENIPDYVMQYDRQHRHIFTNSITLRDNKKTAEEFIGKTHSELGFDPYLCDIWEKALDKVFETGRPQMEVFEWGSPVGVKVLEWRAYPEYAPDGSIESVLGISRDITEQKQAEDKRREALLYTRNLIETSLDPLVTISADGKITDVNEATVKVTGISREKLIGTDFAIYFTEPDKARDGYQLVFSKGMITDYLLTIRHIDGRLTDVLYNASVYKDAAGNVVGVFAAARDITRQKQAEKVLKESEVKHRIVADNTYDWEFWLSPEEKFIYISPSCKRTTGHTVEEFIADPDLLRHIIHPEDRLNFDNHRHGSEHEKKPTVLQFRIVRSDGNIRWIDHICQPVFDKDGKFLGTRGSNRDITERKKAEEEREKLINELKGALANVKTLSGMLPICASCKKIRDDKGYWSGVETYISEHTDTVFSHGMCPECEKKAYEELEKLMKEK